MVCKRCGHDLPLTGYICTNCGAMMSIEQIKEQKAKNPASFIPQGLVSERYGHKDFIYKKREEKKLKLKGWLLYLGLLLGIILVCIFVYF